MLASYAAIGVSAPQRYVGCERRPANAEGRHAGRVPLKSPGEIRNLLGVTQKVTKGVQRTVNGQKGDRN